MVMLTNFLNKRFSSLKYILFLLCQVHYVSYIFVWEGHMLMHLLSGLMSDTEHTVRPCDEHKASWHIWLAVSCQPSAARVIDFDY